ncbi:MAG: hypothetical protein DRH57_05925, partial [Candidatus Cloacimonadota bacterium]
SKTIPKKLKNQMKAYGITQKDWETMRAQKGDFLDVTKLPDELNQKMRKYISEEAQYAVLEPGAANQAYMSLGTNAGTIGGEVVRSATQFKSFLLAGVLTHLSRVLKLDTNLEKAEYALNMATAGVVIGMFVTALKDVKNGDDPMSRDYSSPQGYMSALEQSGMLGPIGNLLKDNNFGDNPLDVVSISTAPILSLLKPGIEMISDKDLEEKLGDVARKVADLMPGQNVWFAQYYIDKMARNMLLLANPKYQAKFDKIDKASAARDSKTGLEELEYFQ